MFANLVNRHDVGHVMAMLRRSKWRSVVDHLRNTRQQRVAKSWSTPLDAVDQWWAIGVVRRRWAEMISGSADEGFSEYAARKYLAGRSNLRGLCLACGTGWGAIRWAETGFFRRIDAFDISPQRVETATCAAASRQLDGILNFQVADMHRIDLLEGGYDAVFAEQALHHFSPLTEALTKVERSLTRDGLLFVDDYVGPNRHQWTNRQLAVANGLLSVLPRRYRITPEGELKTRVVRHSRLRMMLHDPSEAVESAEIMRLLRATFSVAEERGYGGSLLHPLLARIAHNFQDEDDQARGLLDFCFRVEDILLREGEIAHDFMIAVCRRRPPR